MSITVDFNVDDRADSLKPFWERLRPVIAIEGKEAIELDLTRCRYLGPAAAVTLVMVHEFASRVGHTVSVRLPSDPPPLNAYCHFSGLKHWLNAAKMPDDRDPDSETVPVRAFQSASFNLPDEIITLTNRHGQLSRDNEDYLRADLSETVQNVEDHARSSVGGFFSARYFRTTGEVRVAVADRGLGIPNTLRRTHPEIRTDEECLRSVVRGQFSSRSLPRNQGLGLSNLAEHVRNLRGALVLASGTAILEVRAGEAEPKHSKLSYPFPGTFVFFSLNVRSSYL